MIEITPTAQSYFKNLIEQQDDEGLGLRISVNHAGTPGASCDLQFCPQGQSIPDDVVKNSTASTCISHRPVRNGWRKQKSISRKTRLVGN